MENLKKIDYLVKSYDEVEEQTEESYLQKVFLVVMILSIVCIIVSMASYFAFDSKKAPYFGLISVVFFYFLIHYPTNILVRIINWILLNFFLIKEFNDSIIKEKKRIASQLLESTKKISRNIDINQEQSQIAEKAADILKIEFNINL